MPIIEVDHVSKVFPARRGARDIRGRGGLADWIRGRKTETFEALTDISLSVERGESLGIIGRNGSGKSTLLSLIAGVTLPTTGTVTVQGRVASLLELGAGFHPILTGRENVYLNAGLLGMRRAQVDEVFDRIVAFSGIGDFIDQPVETYSSGMYVRIAFAVAAHVNPDVFLVDEVLSVGDEEFQRKCRMRIGELREEGKTIVFVSHDLGIVNTLCDRVALLDKGRMILRETARKTISFYLRQVGREGGVHTFDAGPLEAIFCEGRISLFHQQEELTAPDGFAMNIESLGRQHLSTDADWQLTARGPDGCSAVGRMLRLPLKLIWELHATPERLLWRIAVECERETPMSILDARLALSTAYTRWILGDMSGSFPEIRPSDTTWGMLAFPVYAPPGALRAAVLPEEDNQAIPCALFNSMPRRANFNHYWANSHYAAYCRVLAIHTRFSDREGGLPPGRHELLEITVEPAQSREVLWQRVSSDRTVSAGKVSARFERGWLRLAYDGRELTTLIHVFSSLLVQHLWNDSHNLHWGEIRNDGRCLRVSGESQRFPFTQHWEVDTCEDGVRLRIDLETAEPINVQEYQASVMLLPEYEAWRSDHEEGVFPPFEAGANKWRHLNKTYLPGKRLTALSSVLPSVTLEVTTNETQFRMTPINTREDENARVLQALCASESGLIHFGRGHHPFFEGMVRITPAGS